MELQEFLDRILFEIGQFAISVGELARIIGISVALCAVGYFVLARWLPLFYQKEETAQQARRRISRIVAMCLLLLGLIGVFSSLNIDMVIYEVAGRDPEAAKVSIRISTLLQALLAFYVARLFDWLITEFLVRRYQRQHHAETGEAPSRRVGREAERAGSIVKPIVYTLALMFVLNRLAVNLTLTRIGQGDAAVDFTLNHILTAVLILLGARLLIWVVTQLFLYSYYRRQQVNVGAQYAINRLLTYFVFVIAVLIALEYIGVNLTVLWGGAAALLVGIGLGLQQTFNDLVCGIILLFERTVEVGDVVQIDGLIGSVKRIGIRTSLVETRENITVIVPNSKLVAENVINWSHFERKARFSVKVGVAYGSDTQLVKNLLLEVARGHKQVLDNPEPFVRFTDFGESRLDFEILFWSREYLRIEDVKSDLRFGIDDAFRRAGIVIPFPQRDVWMKQ